MGWDVLEPLYVRVQHSLYRFGVRIIASAGEASERPCPALPYRWLQCIKEFIHYCVYVGVVGGAELRCFRFGSSASWVPLLNYGVSAPWLCSRHLLCRVLDP